MSSSELAVADSDGSVPSPQAIAERAGLVHRSDARPGIRRRRAGRGFTYVDARGRRITGEERQRIEAIAIPPAWNDVWISPESDSHLLASGTDDEGRKQYRYHPGWLEAANAAKFERLAEFARPLSALRAHVEASLRRGADDWVCAAAVRLIDDTLIRPGSFRHFRERGTVGAVTLHRQHVTTTRRRIRLQFEGKHEIEHEVEADDPLLARRISELLDRADGDGPLWVDEAGSIIDAPRLNRYIAEHSAPSYTAKDLRTWGATCWVASQLVARHDGSIDDDDRIRDAIASTAERLGNTVEVCRSAYIAPAVVEGYRTGALLEAWRRSRSAQWLSRCEQTVGRVLREA